MDIISLYYFSELAKDLHITRTASRLFVSQQTLSNHIQRLEEYYGVQLLHRKPALSLTCAGEFVLAFANVVIKENRNLKDILSDIENQERGILRFGASSLRMNACLPEILPAFSARYPNVEVRITDAVSAQLEPMVLNGELDFAIILSSAPHPKLVDQQLMGDQLHLCVADSLLRQYYNEETDALTHAAIQGANIADFARLPFCMNNNRMGHTVMECFNEAGILPHTYNTSSDTRISLSLCCRRLAACVSPHMRLVSQKHRIPDDIHIFPLYRGGAPLTQPLSLIRTKDRYLTHYAKFFLDLLFQFFSDIEHTPMDRIAFPSPSGVSGPIP